MSHVVWNIVEDKEVFEPIKSVNGVTGTYMLMEMIEDSHDGTFPRVSDYTRLANRIDKEGISEYLTWISTKKSKKLVSNTGYCTIERTSKFSNEAVIKFETPIKMCFGVVNGEQIIQEIDQIKGEFDHEWFWMKNGRQDKIANGFEVYFNCKNFVNSKTTKVAA